MKPGEGLPSWFIQRKHSGTCCHHWTVSRTPLQLLPVWRHASQSVTSLNFRWRSARTWACCAARRFAWRSSASPRSGRERSRSLLTSRSTATTPATAQNSLRAAQTRAARPATPTCGYGAAPRFSCRAAPPLRYRAQSAYTSTEGWAGHRKSRVWYLRQGIFRKTRSNASPGNCSRYWWGSKFPVRCLLTKIQPQKELKITFIRGSPSRRCNCI